MGDNVQGKSEIWGAYWGMRVLTTLTIAAGLLCPVTAQANEPITIATIAELQNIGVDPAYPLDGAYVQVADIDASGTNTWNSGAGFSPIGDFANRFTGTFDGQGHEIAGLFIARPNASDVGLFGAIGAGAEILDVRLANASVTGDERVGTLAGLVDGDATVTACVASGGVSGRLNIGGLVGVNDGEVLLSAAAVQVAGDFSAGGLVGSHLGKLEQSFATGSAAGESAVGGLVGGTGGNAEIQSCYATAVVSLSEFGFGGGGLVGTNQGNVVFSYAAGPVSADNGFSVGGLIGLNNGTVSACMWDVDATGLSSSDGGDGHGTESMMQQTTFTNAGWDFATVWDIVADETYPFLRANPYSSSGDNGGDGTADGDINGDGIVNAVDVQLVINAALGLDIENDADINDDGVVNAVDVQLVINAALGLDITP